MSCTPQAPTNFDLLQLPVELQCEVYRNLFPDNSILAFKIRPNSSPHPQGDPEPTMRDVCVRLSEEPPALFQQNGRLPIYPADLYNSFYVTCSAESSGYEQACRYRALLALLKTSSCVRKMLMALLHCDKVAFVIQSSDFNLACWYGINNRLFAPLIKRIAIMRPYANKSEQRERWITHLVRLFPNLEDLHLSGMYTDKLKERWGSCYRRSDLRMLKFVVDNTALRHVFIMHSPRNGFRLLSLLSDPEVLRGSKSPGEPEEIDVVAEWSNSTATPIRTRPPYVKKRKVKKRATERR